MSVSNQSALALNAVGRRSGGERGEAPESVRPAWNRSSRQFRGIWGARISSLQIVGKIGRALQRSCTQNTHVSDIVRVSKGRVSTFTFQLSLMYVDSRSSTSTMVNHRIHQTAAGPQSGPTVA